MMRLENCTHWFFLHTQRTILIQHERNRSKCRLTHEAFDHVTLYVCVTLPINPTSQPLGPPSDPAGHRGNIPDAALFHNSHHVWFFQSRALTARTVENPTEERRSAPCNRSQTRCVWVGIAKVVNNSGLRGEAHRRTSCSCSVGTESHLSCDQEAL